MARPSGSKVWGLLIVMVPFFPTRRRDLVS
jgi:hypothetical protein